VQFNEGEASRPILKPKLAGLDFATRERQLVDEAKSIPTWRLANQARRVLASFVAQCSETFTVRGSIPADSLDSATARRLAVVQLASVAVRQTGAILALVSTGYETEAMAHARTLLEAQLRGRQACNDLSGYVARELLQGRRPKSLKQVARQYGGQREVEMLDHFAHADVRQLMTLVPGFRTDQAAREEPELDLRPIRGLMRPATQLYDAAYMALSLAAILAEVFEVGVEMPPWVSKQLIYYRDHPLPDPL